MGDKMSKQQTITVNGAAYDSHTGMPLKGNDKPSASRPKVGAHVIHKKPSKSQTLSRKHVHTPTGHDKARKSTAKPRVAVSPMITKFADVRPSAKQQTKTPTKAPDIAPVKHPIQHKVAVRTPNKPALHAKKKTTPPAAAEIKQQAITKALHNARPAATTRKTSFARRHPRLISAGTASLAIVLLAGYFTYINLPNLSVRVAAAQAGIDASYPSYQPAGFGIRGPVAYDNGEVSINFQSTTNPSRFTINQSKSNWDSSALLDNRVAPQSGNNYLRYNDNGLTIYVYGHNAAWVNGGILYTIEGDAELSGDQIRRIATSM